MSPTTPIMPEAPRIERFLPGKKPRYGRLKITEKSWKLDGFQPIKPKEARK